MKIAYVFKSNMASTFQLGTMILPQLEDNSHLVNVVGMFFFDDNIMCLQKRAFSKDCKREENASYGL